MNYSIRILLLLILASQAPMLMAGTIKLSNGDIIHAPITEMTDKTVIVNHESLGSITINKDQVTSIIADKEADAILLTTVAEADADGSIQVEEIPVDEGLFNSGWLTDWDREFDIGVNGRQGNTVNAALHAAFIAGYEDDYDRWAYAMAYNFKSEDSKTTDDDFYASLLKDWLKPGSRIFYFANARLDWDQFKDYDYRAGAYGGIGYQILTTDKYSLRGRLGAGGKQQWGGAEEGFIPEGLLGLDFEWTISERQSLVFVTTFYPNLEQQGQYRNISDFAWKVMIDQDNGLGLKIGMNNEYDSLERLERNDFRYNASLVWEGL